MILKLKLTNLQWNYVGINEVYYSNLSALARTAETVMFQNYNANYMAALM